MSKPITLLAETVHFSRDLVGLIRERAREAIEKVLEEELEVALGGVVTSGRRGGPATGTGPAAGG